MEPAATLAAAFQEDTLFRWVQPDDGRRRRGLLPLYRAVVARCRSLGGVVDVDSGGGVATWLPAEQAAMSPSDLVRSGLLRTPLWLGPGAAVRLVRHDAVADPLVQQQGRPGDAYLWALGADPARRGQGYGRRAVEQCVEQAGRAGAARLLLKTENPDNVGLYEHLGFTVVREQPVDVSGLTVWVFVRPTA